MTYGELLRNTPHTERYEYVYMWLYKTKNGDMPFYVGMGRGNRYKCTSSRSKTFQEFLRKHECYSIICVKNLTPQIARIVERAIKSELMTRGISLLDGEDNMKEHKRRQSEGIAAMPVINGKKVSTKTGRAYGRPASVVEADFQKFLEKQKEGIMSVTECCKELGISRATWYNRVAEVRV